VSGVDRGATADSAARSPSAPPAPGSGHKEITRNRLWSLLGRWFRLCPRAASVLCILLCASTAHSVTSFDDNGKDQSNSGARWPKGERLPTTTRRTS
jgi:hypothetical protein